MNCPFCSHPNNQVIDTRPSLYNQIAGIRRRRECDQCHKRFSSFEMTINDLEGVEPATLDGLLQGIIKLFKDAPVTHYKALPAPLVVPLKVDGATRREEPRKGEKKGCSSVTLNGNSIKEAMRRARQKYIDDLDEFDEEDFD